MSFSRLLSISALATIVAAQGATFRVPIPTTVYIGQVVPIEWTVGNGEGVYGTLGNTTFNFPIFVDQPAPGEFDWAVTLPTDVVPGLYQIAIKQADAPAVYSDPFTIAAITNPTSSMTTTPSVMPVVPMTTSAPPMGNASMPIPMVVEVWDEECGCTKTTTTSTLPCAATGTGVPATTYTWYDDECGCTKTAMAPAATSGAGNSTAPMMTTAAGLPMAPSSTMAAPVSAYSASSAARQVVGGLGIVALVVAALV